MAVIDIATVGIHYEADHPHKCVLMQLPKVANGDTFDLSTKFTKIQAAVFLGVTESVYFLPTINVASLTFTNVNLVNTAGFLMVLGGTK